MSKITKRFFLFSFTFILVVFNFISFTTINTINESIKNLNSNSKEFVPYTAETFSDMIYSSVDSDNNIDITLDRDIDLSDFSSSPLDMAGQDNSYAIHGLNNVTIDFNGYTVSNKTYNFIANSAALSEVPNNYIPAAQLLYDNDWADISQVDGANPIASYYYVYWFYDIENLTLKNASFQNVPFVAYDINNLTIEDSIFSNMEISGIYFARNVWSENIIVNVDHVIGAIADQVSNLNLKNILVENYSIKQNIFNYQLQGETPKPSANAQVGLFTRIGYDENSQIIADNVAFENIDISLNDRGLATNGDGQMNYGIFVAMKGSAAFSNMYFNNISFYNDNDLNTLNTRQNSLFSFVTDYTSLDSNDANYNLSFENIFVGNIYSTVDDSMFITSTAYEYDGSQVYLENSSTIPPKKLDNVYGYSEIEFVSYTEQQKDELYNENGLSEELIFLNTFQDDSSLKKISFNEASSSKYFNNNFDNDYFTYESKQLPMPIDEITIGAIDQDNAWKNLEISVYLKSGFYIYNEEDLTVTITNNTDNEKVIEETINYDHGGPLTFSYKKPSGDRLDRYSLSIYSQGNDSYITNNYALVKAKFPALIIILIILIFLIVVALIIFIALFLLKSKNSTEMAVVTEANDLAMQLYDYQYDVDYIDSYYEYLDLPRDAGLKKVQKLQNRNIVDYKKGKISKEEFDNKSISITAIIDYLKGGNN